ncbi:ABC transporter ATP-binding protein [Rosettibacter firmus]|uniref:ABC transporter ATP-binding protein n=1 Tax=Rosettibacter firmus TaxID=3111522 RepID=UPI00336C15B8
MILELFKVDKYLNNTLILKNINFTLSEGEIVGLIGPNGAGKTTLLRLLATLYKPDSGTITFEGNDVFVNPENFRRIIGYMPEESGFYNKLNAFENLSFYAGFFNNITRTDILNKLNEYNLNLNKKVGAFSKGQKQLLLFIKSIIHNPDILILDEPFNALDPGVRITIRETIKNFSNNNKIIIFSSHILSDLEQLCNRYIFLKKGEIVSDIRKTQENNSQGINIEELYKKIIT